MMNTIKTIAFCVVFICTHLICMDQTQLKQLKKTSLPVAIMEQLREDINYNRIDIEYISTTLNRVYAEINMKTQEEYKWPLQEKINWLQDTIGIEKTIYLITNKKKVNTQQMKKFFEAAFKDEEIRRKKWKNSLKQLKLEKNNKKIWTTITDDLTINDFNFKFYHLSFKKGLLYFSDLSKDNLWNLKKMFVDDIQPLKKSMSINDFNVLMNSINQKKKTLIQEFLLKIKFGTTLSKSVH